MSLLVSEGESPSVVDPGEKFRPWPPIQFAYRLFPLQWKNKSEVLGNIKLLALAECLDPTHDVALQPNVWIQRMMWPP